MKAQQIFETECTKDALTHSKLLDFLCNIIKQKEETLQDFSATLIFFK